MKILLAQFPLEVHSRGLTFVANLLRDAGHEVVVLGNARPEEIASTAADEGIDVIGISVYCGGAVEQSKKMLQWFAGIVGHNVTITRINKPHWMIGGIFPQAHEAKLREMGFVVFPSGSDPQKILDYVGAIS